MAKIRKIAAGQGASGVRTHLTGLGKHKESAVALLQSGHPFTESSRNLHHVLMARVRDIRSCIQTNHPARIFYLYPRAMEYVQLRNVHSVRLKAPGPLFQVMLPLALLNGRETRWGRLLTMTVHPEMSAHQKR